jgi:GAF domain-containing protein
MSLKKIERMANEMNRLTPLKPASLTDSTEDIEQRSAARMLQALLIIILIANLVSLIVTFAGNFGLLLALPLALLAVSSAIALVLLRQGMLTPARYILPITLYIGITFIIAIGNGLHDIDVIALAGVIAIAGLTLGQDAVLVFGGLVVLALFGIGIAEIQGWLTSSTRSLTNLISPVNMSIVVLAIAFVQRIMIQRLNESIQHARQNEQKQIVANKALEEERANLETRVKERTHELERRAIQLRAAAEVGNIAAATQDIDALLTKSTNLLSLRFGFYHVGIFLKDETGRYAVLRAANSEGGQRMLRRGHRLEVGQVGIVGYVTQAGKARIALDVGKDAVYFDNLDLPGTHSEMALPLKVAENILGALDIQSTEREAFQADDIEVLQVVADQLAVAIENARLLAESRAATEAVRRAYGEVSLEAWKNKLEHNAFAFRSTERGNVSAVEANLWNEDEQQAIRTGTPVRTQDEKTLYVPILLRGKAIGLINLLKRDQSFWSDTDIQLAQALSDQLSGSLEAARLYDDAQRRSLRERTIGEISTKISTFSDVDAILKSAVEELGSRLSSSTEVILELGDDGKE